MYKLTIEIVLTLAPNSISVSTTLTWPFSAAACKAVHSSYIQYINIETFIHTHKCNTMYIINL